MKDASVTNKDETGNFSKKREIMGQDIRAEEIRIYSTRENENERCMYKYKIKKFRK